MKQATIDTLTKKNDEFDNGVLLTEFKLQTVREFVDSYKTEHGAYRFPEVNKKLSDLIGEEVEYRMVNQGKDNEYTYITVGALYIVLHNKGKFEWGITFDDTHKNIFGVVNLFPLIEKIYMNQDDIEQIYTETLPEYNERVRIERLYNLSGQIKIVEHFFEKFSGGEKSCYTKEGLLKMHKIKLENWYEEGFKDIYGGKLKSLEWYREVFQRFDDCYKQILELKQK